MRPLTMSLLVLIGAAPATAYGASVQDLTSSIKACRTLDSDTARLACFDAIALSSAGAEQGAAVDTAADMSAAQQDRSQTQPPKTPDFGEDDLVKAQTKTENEETKLTATVTAIRKTRSGKYVFDLDNGQTWRQLQSDSTRMYLPRKPGFQIELEKGVLGSYFLRRVGKKQSMRVQRLN